MASTKIRSSLQFQIDQNLDLNSKKIINLSNPTADTDAATKGYVDAVAHGIRHKEPVNIATSQVINIDQALPNPLYGITLYDGFRILLLNGDDNNQLQDGKRNGIWEVYTSGGSKYLRRPVDFATDTHAAGTAVWVLSAPTPANDPYSYAQYADTGFICITDPGQDTIDSNPIQFVQFTGLGQITVNHPLSKNGNTLSLNYNSSNLELVSNALSVKERSTIQKIEHLNSSNSSVGTASKLKVVSATPGLIQITPTVASDIATITIDHASGDGNLHVPATGTSNNNKVLKAGATAGSIAWGSVAIGEVTGIQSLTVNTTSTASSVSGGTYSPGTATTITIFKPNQNLDTTSSVQFSKIGAGTAADTTADIKLNGGYLLSGVADGSTAIAFKLNSPSYTNASAKLLSVQNNGVEKFAIDKDGNVTFSGKINAQLIGSGNVDNTEFGYLDGVTSNIQTQINNINTTLGTKLTTSKYKVRQAVSGTINGTNVTFTLPSTPVAGTEMVFLNGILQNQGASNDYTISGTTITFTSAPATGDVILVTYIES